MVRDAGALTSSITGGSIGLPENVYTLDSPLDDATTAKVFTQELRLSGGDDALRVGGRRLLQPHPTRDYGQSLLVGGFEPPTGHPDRGPARRPKDVLFYSDLHYELDQFALFGEVTWQRQRRASA